MASKGGSLINVCPIPWPLSGHPGFLLREGQRLPHWDVPSLWSVGTITGAEES